jgi:uncharacterized RDD family membrane protein YckC
MSDPNAGSNPFQPPQASVSEVPVAGLEPGGRWERLGAALIDSLAVPLVIYLPVIFVGAPSIILALSRHEQPVFTPALVGAFAASFLLVIAWIVVTIMFVSRYGQTIGKRIVGVKVVRNNGERAGLGRIFWLRNVVSALPALIPLVGSIYGLVDILFIFGDSRRCIHDMIGDTKVVRA